MNPLRILLLVVLALSLLSNAGCAMASKHHVGHDADAVTAHSDGHVFQDAREARHGGAKAALYAFAGFLIVTVVVVDLMLLPFTYHQPFPCCRGVLRICH